MALEYLKKLFPANEDGTPKAMTFEELEAAITADKGISLINLKDGGYVAQDKFDRKQKELEQARAAIENLNGTIAKNTADLEELQKQVKAAEGDATKIADLTSQITQLQTDAKTNANNFENQQREYQEQLAKQANEFAIRTKVNGLKFSSTSARRSFTHDILEAGLKVDGENVLGFDDYVNKYKTEIDPDAFAKEEPEPEPKPDVSTQSPPPIFAAATSTGSKGASSQNLNLGSGFSFNAVRSVEK